MKKDLDIKPYHDSFKQQIVSIWEESVRATHNFLLSSDIDYFKTIVAGIDFNAIQVFCLCNGDNVLGFIGVGDAKVEMLFLSPDYIGKGLGKKLMKFAMTELKVDKVDVNEQNHSAVRFYSRMGFVQYDRTDTDSEGKPYPILKMRLEDRG